MWLTRSTSKPMNSRLRYTKSPYLFERKWPIFIFFSILGEQNSTKYALRVNLFISFFFLFLLIISDGPLYLIWGLKVYWFLKVHRLSHVEVLYFIINELRHEVYVWEEARLGRISLDSLRYEIHQMTWCPPRCFRWLCSQSLDTSQSWINTLLVHIEEFH